MKIFKIDIPLIVITFIHITFLSLLKFFPYPELFIYSYLTKSGLVPYSQIIDQHFPGLVFFPINLSTLGLDSVLALRLVSFVLVVLMHLGLYSISKKIIKQRSLLFIPNLLFLIWHPYMEGYVLWIDNFAAVTLTYAFYFLIVHKSYSRFISGLLFGLTFLLKQTVAPLYLFLAVYLFVVTKNRRNLYPTLVGFGLCVMVLITWVAVMGNWKDFYYWTFSFNLTVFAQMGRKFPTFKELVKILPILVAPMVSIFNLRVLRKRNQNVILLLIFYVGCLFFAYARFDYVHFQPALPFSTILIVYFVYLLEKPFYKSLLYSFVAFSILFNIYLIRPFFGKSTYFFGEAENILVQKVNLYRDNGKVFALGTTPHIYYLTKTLPPGNVFVFQFPWFMKMAEPVIYKGLVEDAPQVVIRDKVATVGGYNLVEYMPKISSFVAKYYKVIDSVGDVEIMVKNR